MPPLQVTRQTPHSPDPEHYAYNRTLFSFELIFRAIVLRRRLNLVNDPAVVSDIQIMLIRIWRETREEQNLDKRLALGGKSLLLRGFFQIPRGRSRHSVLCPSSTATMRLRFNLATLGLALWFPLICQAQGGSANQPEAVAKLFVDAINSKSADRRLALLHPKSRACINTQTQPYYDWIFSRQLKHVIPAANYKVAATPLSGKPALPSDGKSEYPLSPSHQLQIDFNTGPYSSTSIVLFIVRDSARWYEVLPCPGPDDVAGIRAIEAKRAERERNIESLVARLADPLRAEITALARQGRRIDAIKRYRDATGEDLTTAKDVVDLLAPR
jgi:hypothetical protein